MQLAELLHDGVQQLNLKLSKTAETKLLEYVSLLIKWNKAYNLTAIKDPRDIIIKHILDSLAIVPYITGQTILDVGTGAGLPGIPLALTLPDKHFILLDSNSKKIRFLTHTVTTLELTNVEIVQQRVEQYQPQQQIDCIITRAVTALADIINKTKHLHSDLLAMQGKYPQEELQKIQKHAIVHALKIPFLSEQRHLVVIKETKSG